MQIMFDLETLDTRHSAVILTLGAVKFNPATGQVYEDEGILLRFNADEQLGSLKRTYSEDTIQWWNQQAPEIQEEAFNPTNRLSVTDAVDQFHKYVWNSDRVWSQGSFDVNIMENLYQQLNRHYPWNYWQIRDSRTLFDFVEPEMDRSKHHDALQDAIEQAKGVCKALKKIGWHGKKIV